MSNSVRALHSVWQAKRFFWNKTGSIESLNQKFLKQFLNRKCLSFIQHFQAIFQISVKNVQKSLTAKIFLRVKLIHIVLYIQNIFHILKILNKDKVLILNKSETG